MLDIGTEPSGLQMHLAAGRVFAKQPTAFLRRLRQQINRPIQADFQKIVTILQAGEASLIFQIRAIATKAGLNHLSAFGMHADIARQRQQFQRVFKVDAAGGHAFRKGGPFRLFCLRVTKLHIGTIRPVANIDRQAAVRIVAKMAVTDDAGLGILVLAVGDKLAGEFTFRIVRTADEGTELAKPQAKPAAGAIRAAAHQCAGIILLEEMRAKILVKHVDHVGDRQFAGAVDGRLEIAPELRQQLFPVELAVGYGVELPLKLGGEVIFDIAAEEAVQEGHDKPAAILRNELAAVLDNIVAILKYLDDRGIGRGPANAKLLHRLHKAGIGETRRRLCEMLFRRDLARGQRFTLVDGGEDGAVIGLVGFDLVGGRILTFLIDRPVPVEHDNAAAGPQGHILRPVGDVDGRLVQFGRLHLAGDGALPDQIIETRLVVIEKITNGVGRPRGVGRSDRLVRLLGVRGGGAVDPRRIGKVAVAKTLADLAAHAGDGLAAELNTVGPHVGDQAGGLAADIDAFIKPLRDLHCPAGRKAELSRGFLLQRRGGERRFRIFTDAAGLDVRDLQSLGLDGGGGGDGLGLGADIQLAKLLAIQMGEARLEISPVSLSKLGLDGPVFLRDEGLDGGFALADQTQRHRLHAACRPRARQLAPQHWRDREADKIIKRPSGAIGVDEFGIKRTRLRHRGQNGTLRHFVEDDALYRLLLDQIAILKQFEDMPADGLALTVRVGRQDQPVRPAQCLCDVADMPLGAAGDLPFHGEVLFRKHRAVLAWQIADMPVRGQNLIVIAKIAVDGFGFRGGFDDYEFHERPCCLKPADST